MGYNKKNVSLSEETDERVKKVADYYGMPQSCVLNIAVSKPEAYKKLTKVAGVETAEDDILDFFSDKSKADKKEDNDDIL